MNKKILITEREFEMINALARGQAVNQRELSAKTGMSLGLTNLVLKRLVKKGLLKIRQLNRRKVEYLLTSKGFSEKAKKSYRYMLKTISNINVIKTRIQEIVLQEMENGRTDFVMTGDGDFHDIVELAFNGLKAHPLKLRRLDVLSKSDLNQKSVVLVASENSSLPSFVPNPLNIIDAISKGHPSQN